MMAGDLNQFGGLDSLPVAGFEVQGKEAHLHKGLIIQK
jgi:hypothetical protein